MDPFTESPPPEPTAWTRLALISDTRARSSRLKANGRSPLARRLAAFWSALVGADPAARIRVDYHDIAKHISTCFASTPEHRSACVRQFLTIAACTHRTHPECALVYTFFGACGLLYDQGLIPAPDPATPSPVMFNDATARIVCTSHRMKVEELGRARPTIARSLARYCSHATCHRETTVAPFPFVYLAALRLCFWAEAIHALARAPPPCSRTLQRVDDRFRSVVSRLFPIVGKQFNAKSLMRRATMATLCPTPMTLPATNFRVETALNHLYGAERSQAALQLIMHYELYTGEPVCTNPEIRRDMTKQIGVGADGRVDAADPWICLDKPAAIFAHQLISILLVLQKYIRQRVAFMDDLFFSDYPIHLIDEAIEAHDTAARSPKTDYIVYIHAGEAFVIMPDRTSVGGPPRSVIGPFTNHWHVFSFVLMAGGIDARALFLNMSASCPDDEEEEEGGGGKKKRGRGGREGAAAE